MSTAYPLIQCLTGILVIDAGQNLHQRRFSGAVFADQRMDLAGAQLELCVIQRTHAWKTLVDSFHLDQNFMHTRFP